jgi:hypothetical protein
VRASRSASVSPTKKKAVNNVRLANHSGFFNTKSNEKTEHRAQAINEKLSLIGK